MVLKKTGPWLRSDSSVHDCIGITLILGSLTKELSKRLTVVIRKFLLEDYEPFGDRGLPVV